MNSMREAIKESALSPAHMAEGVGTQSFRFDEDFLGFAGHFPGYPILPAVLQTLMAQLLAEQVVGLPLQFLSLERAKFTHQLRPGDQIDVNVSCLEKEGQLHCTCKLLVENRRAASFTLLFDKGSRL